MIIKFLIGHDEVLIYLIEFFKLLETILDDRFSCDLQKWLALIESEWMESGGVAASEEDSFHGRSVGRNGCRGGVGSNGRSGCSGRVGSNFSTF